jgi:hypothetical protein
MKNAEASSTRSSVPLLVSAEVRFLRHMAETSRKEARPFYFSPFFGGGLSPLPSYSCIGLRSAVPGLHPRQLYLPACHFCAGSSSCHFGASSSIPDFGVGSSFSHRRASSSISHFGAGSSISRSWCRSCSSCSRSLSWNPGWSSFFKLFFFFEFFLFAAFLCFSPCLLAAGGDFHLFPGGVGSWLQMQPTHSDWNGEVAGGSSPLELNDDDDVVELRNTDACIQFH